jgi:hypothetical protein
MSVQIESFGSQLVGVSHGVANGSVVRGGV